MPDPRYNMFAFTQPYYAVQFAQNNTSDGFYQRFLLSVPQEVYVKINDKKQLKEQQEQLVDVGKLVLTTEAMQVYEKYHDEVVDYRKSDAFEEAKLSIKSKSRKRKKVVTGFWCNKPNKNVFKRNRRIFGM